MVLGFTPGEVAVIPLAFHLPPTVLVRNDLEHDSLTEDGYRLEALVPSDVLMSCTSVRLDSVSADHLG